MSWIDDEEEVGRDAAWGFKKKVDAASRLVPSSKPTLPAPAFYNISGHEPHGPIVSIGHTCLLTLRKIQNLPHLHSAIYQGMNPIL